MQAGRLGAIKLEQLDELLISLKTYWVYNNNIALFESLRAPSNDYALEPTFML